MSEAKGIRLIVGLGNPGSEYERTRHNAGFWFADAVAAKYGAFFREEKKFQGEVCRCRIGQCEVWLLKPLTFMNRSGDAAAALAQYYKISPEEILVVHDEMDLMPGTLKIKQGGGNAGHNGLKDLTAKLGTPNFWRLRLGTGHPRTLGLAQQVFDFVLSAPSTEHEAGIRKMIEVSLPCLDNAVAGDMARVTRTLSKYGSLPKPQNEEAAA